MQAELDEKIGSSRLIEASDRAALVYTNAVIQEVQRLANIVPSNLLHLNNEPLTIRGVQIPARCAIMPQLSTVLFDEKVGVLNVDECCTRNNFRFSPIRTASSRNDSSTRRPASCEKSTSGSFLASVSASEWSTIDQTARLGRRACPGEALARLQLFLIIANIFNQFNIEAEFAGKPPSSEKIVRFVVKCHAFRVRISPRH